MKLKSLDRLETVMHKAFVVFYIEKFFLQNQGPKNLVEIQSRFLYCVS